MSVVTVGFRWLDILEKEFDKAFVDLEVLVGDVCEYEEGEIVAKAQHRLQSLSSCFAQLTHKAQTIFQNNAKLEAELVHLRREVAEGKGRLAALQQQELHSQEQHVSSELNAPTSEHDKLLNNHEVEVSTCQAELPCLINTAEVSQLQQENKSLRRLLLRLQGELCGARLAAKYLDKELAGRIQQLQLLGRETRWQQQEDKLWRQLEAEINLHRHKTVVRACRANIPAHTGMQTECTTASEVASEDASEVLGNHLHDDQPRPRPQHHERTVVIHKLPHQNLGMSVTGGREHGVPIVVSVVHPNTPASLCKNLYVGDAILAVNGQDLSVMNHSDAVALLSQPAETVTLQLLFVPPESDETCSNSDDPFTFRYGLFDDDVVSLASSSCSVVPRRCPPPPPALDSLSRASVESVRGSCDNLLLAESVAPLVAESADTSVQASSSLVPNLNSGAAPESKALLNNITAVDSSHSNENENGRLLTKQTVKAERGAGIAMSEADHIVVEVEQKICEETPSSIPLFSNKNSSPLAPMYRRHSSSNVGPPSSPPTPVHKKHSSSNSVRRQNSNSRSASMSNFDKGLDSCSMMTARSKYAPVVSGTDNDGIRETSEKMCGGDTYSESALPFSRRSSPPAVLNSSNGAAAGANDSPSLEVRATLPEVEQKMTALSEGETTCKKEYRLSLQDADDGRCSDTIIFNGSY